MDTNLTKNIYGYEKTYSISSNGSVWSKRNSMWLKPDIRRGYLYYSLCTDGKRKSYTAHRLVAMHFIKKVDNKRQVNHINGIKSDNRLENLEWCTPGENQKHALANGLMKPKKGILNGQSKLTEKDIKDIRQNTKLNQRELAKKYRISFQQVSRIINKTRWKHI